MTTDRELLELAARAAGVDGKYREGVTCGINEVVRAGIYNGNWWNPLTDDGDALRLAVKLGIHISPDCSGQSYANSTFETINDNGGDTYAATRRAIVRAAAAIGEGK